MTPPPGFPIVPPSALWAAVQELAARPSISSLGAGLAIRAEMARRLVNTKARELTTKPKQLAFLVLFWSGSFAGDPALLAQNRASEAIRFVSAANVSDRFQREAFAATRSVPKQVWSTLDEAGWRVELAEFVVDAAPSLRGVRPNGWPEHLTWDNSDAIHLPAARLLVVAEKRRNRSGEVVASSRVARVLRHEIGHAFDMAAGRNGRSLSASRQFAEAYEQDIRRIARSDRESLAYYLQDSRSGLQEAFAEAFAVALGGGSSDIDPASFESRFPRVMAYTRQAIANPPAIRPTTQRARVVSGASVRWRLIRRQ